MVVIANPLYTLLAADTIVAWSYYAKTTSIRHQVYFQVWRPVKVRKKRKKTNRKHNAKTGFVESRADEIMGEIDVKVIGRNSTRKKINRRYKQSSSKLDNGNLKKKEKSENYMKNKLLERNDEKDGYSRKKSSRSNRSLLKTLENLDLLVKKKGDNSKLDAIKQIITKKKLESGLQQKKIQRIKWLQNLDLHNKTSQNFTDICKNPQRHTQKHKKKPRTCSTNLSQKEHRSKPRQRLLRYPQPQHAIDNGHKNLPNKKSLTKNKRSFYKIKLTKTYKEQNRKEKEKKKFENNEKNNTKKQLPIHVNHHHYQQQLRFLKENRVIKAKKKYAIKGKKNEKRSKKLNGENKKKHMRPKKVNVIQYEVRKNGKYLNYREENEKIKLLKKYSKEYRSKQQQTPRLNQRLVQESKKTSNKHPETHPETHPKTYLETHTNNRPYSARHNKNKNQMNFLDFESNENKGNNFKKHKRSNDEKVKDLSNIKNSNGLKIVDDRNMHRKNKKGKTIEDNGSLYDESEDPENEKVFAGVEQEEEEEEEEEDEEEEDDDEYTYIYKLVGQTYDSPQKLRLNTIELKDTVKKGSTSSYTRQRPRDTSGHETKSKIYNESHVKNHIKKEYISHVHSERHNTSLSEGTFDINGYAPTNSDETKTIHKNKITKPIPARDHTIYNTNDNFNKFGNKNNRENKKRIKHTTVENIGRSFESGTHNSFARDHLTRRYKNDPNIILTRKKRQSQQHRSISQPPIRVQPGDVLGIYFPYENPIAWTSIPCALNKHRHLYVIISQNNKATATKNYPSKDFSGNSFKHKTRKEDDDTLGSGALQEGDVLEFKRGSGDCRQYSLTALLGWRLFEMSFDL